VKRALALAGIAVLLGAVGLKVGTDEAFSIALYKLRPHVLRYGPRARLGRCTVRESENPASDVLSNLIDVDSDGRSDYRLTAFVDASPAFCERKQGLWWRTAPIGECLVASHGCEAEMNGGPPATR
jgi:hypothetical protein